MSELQVVSRESQSPQKSVSEIAAKSKIAIHNRNAKFMRSAFGYSLAVYLATLLLQGFQLWGFHLPESILVTFGAVTVGQLAGLFTMIIRESRGS